MKREILDFLLIGRSIFGVCPRSGELFRLSDCRVYIKNPVKPDWLDSIEKAERLLECAEERLEGREEKLRSKARELGRKLANKIIKKIDCVFKPFKLNPDDSKVIFHPVDYIVFNGMNSHVEKFEVKGSIKNITFLDRKAKGVSRLMLQKSIEQTIEKGNYEWQTLRILDNGQIKIE